MLQMLTETIETLGSLDRMAIADHILQEQIQKLDRRDPANARADAQQGLYGRPVANNFFSGVAGIGYTQFAPVKLKTSWG